MAGNIRQEKIFANFATCLHGRNFYPANFLSHIDNYTEDMSTFTALAKIYYVRLAVKFFVQRKFWAI